MHLGSRTGNLEEYPASHIECPKVRCKHKLYLSKHCNKTGMSQSQRRLWVSSSIKAIRAIRAGKSDLI